MNAETEVPSRVRGYHVYEDIWAAAVGEGLTCSRDPSNASDRYAVAVTYLLTAAHLSLFTNIGTTHKNERIVESPQIQ